jgi:hypothetical protein
MSEGLNLCESDGQNSRVFCLARQIYTLQDKYGSSSVGCKSYPGASSNTSDLRPSLLVGHNLRFGPFVPFVPRSTIVIRCTASQLAEH